MIFDGTNVPSNLSDEMAKVVNLLDGKVVKGEG